MLFQPCFFLLRRHAVQYLAGKGEYPLSLPCPVASAFGKLFCLGSIRKYCCYRLRRSLAQENHLIAQGMDGAHSLSYRIKGELHLSRQLLAELAVVGHGNLVEQLLDKGQFGGFSDWLVLRIELHVLTEA